MVFNSANRYRSMKYSWQNRQAPFLRPSMVEALMINSISGMGLAAGSPHQHHGQHGSDPCGGLRREHQRQWGPRCQPHP